uniref:Ig-like domain-containing protein n=1 Tax=Sparus aurata TaxID=8175 RepID=A0A671WAY1_SPAAU
IILPPWSLSHVSKHLSPPGLSHGDGVLPDSLTAAVGETVTFTTTVTPPEMPFLVVTWSFSDVNIIMSQTAINITDPAYPDRITLFPSTGSLELRDLTLNDTGEYTVTIISNLLHHFLPLKLKTYRKPFVTTSSTDLVELSGSVSLFCSASGSSPSFLWLNSSSDVTASDRVQLTDGGATLTVVSVTRYDQGPFTCHVSNLFPFFYSTYKPFIDGPENINLTSPSQEYHVEGSNISLSCSAASRPAAVFYWLLNGDKLFDTGPELRLVNIQMSQNGNYSCQAFNNKTLRYETSQPSAVTVLGKLK